MMFPWPSGMVCSSRVATRSMPTARDNSSTRDLHMRSNGPRLGSGAVCLWVVLIAAAMVACGCGHAPTAPQATDGLSATPKDTTEFWYDLARRPVANNDAATHALALYIDGNDPADNYATRVAALEQRNLLPQGFQGQ